MSIFSGLSIENIRLVIEAAKSSPEALVAVAIIAVAVIAALGIAAAIAAHHIGGFYAHIQEEEERLQAEEDDVSSRKELEE